MTQNPFGTWLAEARAEKEWSQEQLATETKGEVSVKTISAIEQGRIQDPRLSTVESLCRALGRSFFAEAQRYNAETLEASA
ncbi:transcriptional regulator with XRE-family HTH domain [Deinococcus sp. HSC-46F16]|uniref:helix-turn-helix transcriptional regulator n=1 Tax=Deinococcus sp. HSC-46F16 TaxID=2910968 RepID=UPI00209EB84C|nr:helix-turn-helix transcriptional regulator [Deinococcus sp. HSC-46F16]MCP2015650.1 transcriptional regulator with XRE-family HTH domain [Deinococcus sp. HSC-46F16]